MCIHIIISINIIIMISISIIIMNVMIAYIDINERSPNHRHRSLKAF